MKLLNDIACNLNSIQYKFENTILFTFDSIQIWMKKNVIMLLEKKTSNKT
jgi:hypothetical protein